MIELQDVHKTYDTGTIALNGISMKMLEQINALGTTVLVVTRERELVNRFTKRVVAINEGRIISDGMDGYYLNEEE